MTNNKGCYTNNKGWYTNNKGCYTNNKGCYNLNDKNLAAIYSRLSMQLRYNSLKICFKYSDI
jgi:hypothetical protein